MGKNVFANGMEIAHAAGVNKVVAAFPDVCLSPPSPPAGPVPVPYADTSTAPDLQEGSKDVTIGGKPVALHGQSYFDTSPLGNEAATKSFGGSLLTKQVTGKTYFQASSMNVGFEGLKVNRHLDLCTSNHGSEPPGTPPMPSMESMSPSLAGTADDGPKCPCCHNAAHPNQLQPDGSLSPVVSQDKYYADRIERFTARRNQMQAILDRGKAPPWATKPGKDANPAYDGLSIKDIIINKGNDAGGTLEQLREVTAANPDCPNLHNPPDDDCGTHFEPNGNAAAARVIFEKERTRYLSRYRRANPHQTAVTGSSQVNHKTPLAAGGCPTSDTNLIPDPVLEGPCADIEALQTRIQSFQE
jgi:uncharacterized Zn-binding protein involved in type VI secretion